MEKILNLIRDRKWDTLIFIVMLAIITVTSPFAIRWGIQSALSPLVVKVEKIYDIQYRQIQKSAIAAYDKINGDTEQEWVDKLESSTQNAVAIEIALSFPEIKEVLMTIDRKRTEFFCKYFNIGT